MPILKVKILLFILIFLATGACSLFPGDGLSSASYKIGDRGPGGGWIFYDKGFSSDGWQYLEAAPDDLGQAEWGCVGKSIPDAKKTGTGAGRFNTEAILKMCKENNCAARLAVNYSSGGKNDWFLPSRDELNAMYINLNKRGIGNFKSIYYWSSSEQGSTSAWYQSFGTGDQSYNDKDYPYGLIRTVRAF